jgi:hypothetical protein
MGGARSAAKTEDHGRSGLSSASRTPPCRDATNNTEEKEEKSSAVAARLPGRVSRKRRILTGVRRIENNFVRRAFGNGSRLVVIGELQSAKLGGNTNLLRAEDLDQRHGWRVGGGTDDGAIGMNLDSGSERGRKREGVAGKLSFGCRGLTTQNHGGLRRQKKLGRATAQAEKPGGIGEEAISGINAGAVGCQGCAEIRAGTLRDDTNGVNGRGQRKACQQKYECGRNKATAHGYGKPPKKCSNLGYGK